MRSTWTDERLDDFREHVDQRFDAVDRRFDAVDRRFDRVESKIDAQGARIDSLQHTILLVGGGLFAAFIAVLAAMLGLIATQL